MKQFIAIILAGFMTLGFTARAQDDITTAAPAADTAPLPDRLRAWFEPLAETRDFSGVVAVRRDGELIAWEAFGYTDWEAGTRFSTRTRFPAGRITRNVTIALARDLIATDRLSTQDTPAGTAARRHG